MRRTNGVPVDAPLLDPHAPPPLDRVVHANHDRLLTGDEGADEQSEQDAGKPAAGPSVAVQHAVIGGELRQFAASGGAQRRGDGASAGNQDCSHHEHQDMLPGSRRERGSERQQPLSQSPRHITPICLRHSSSPKSAPQGDSTISSPLRIVQAITFDSITQDSIPFLVAQLAGKRHLDSSQRAFCSA